MLVVILLVTLTGSGAKFTDSAGSDATAISFFVAISNDNSVAFKVDKTLVDTRPPDIGVK
ncbi:hypothetical protein G708_02686 [Escherichia coli HVH 32 (4-3773988)]|nr:hypothetical protein G708_02686 [Escherichia coli HVH 32 (4-3773988)]